MRSKQFRYRLEAMGLGIPLGFFRLFGLDRGSALGGAIGGSIGPKLGVSRRARRNIAAAMPELSAQEIDKIVADMWVNLGRTIAEYAFLRDFVRPSEHRRITVEGVEILDAARARGAGGLLVSGHFANWELMPLAMSIHGYEGGEVYRHANNPYINEWVVELRAELTRAIQIPKGATGARQIIRLLKENKFVAMLVDQKMNDGIEATFFGRPAMTTAAPAGLAVRYNVPIIPAWIERMEGAHFRLKVYEPIQVIPDAEPFSEILRITQVLNDFLEARIRERVDGWLWVHNRWKV